MKYPEQSRVFRMIPGLENAEFVRFGQIHRNSYIHSPRLLHATLQARTRPQVFFAGQLCGVEGYVESIATGLLAGINAARLALGKSPVFPPKSTACGSLLDYIASEGMKNFHPVNISFGLLGTDEELIKRIRDKKERRRIQVKESLNHMAGWIRSLNLG
jgi:methylenetetrahydrofolate--tRNA-(uracil-5-)-methyltransferase